MTYLLARTKWLTLVSFCSFIYASICQPLLFLMYAQPNKTSSYCPCTIFLTYFVIQHQSSSSAHLECSKLWAVTAPYFDISCRKVWHKNLLKAVLHTILKHPVANIKNVTQHRDMDLYLNLQNQWVYFNSIVQYDPQWRKKSRSVFANS